YHDQISVGVWVKFDDSSDNQSLIKKHRVNNTGAGWLEVNCDDRNIEVNLWENGTNTTYTFDNYTVPDDEWLYMLVVVDKTDGGNEEARLYVGDESDWHGLVDTVAIKPEAQMLYDFMVMEGNVPVQLNYTTRLTLV